MFNKDGTVNDEMLATLRRPYASAVAGQTISQFFDEETLDYELLYLANEVTNTQTSVLYVPQEVYNDMGLRFAVPFSTNEDIQFSFDDVDQNVFYFNATQPIEAGTQIAIRVEHRTEP